MLSDLSHFKRHIRTKKKSINLIQTNRFLFHSTHTLFYWFVIAAWAHSTTDTLTRLLRAFIMHLSSRNKQKKRRRKTFNSCMISLSLVWKDRVFVAFSRAKVSHKRKFAFSVFVYVIFFWLNWVLNDEIWTFFSSCISFR